jgi:NAD(P)-dependent dehydrogenase (short-subunit alcohol dehydrogenase family)
MTTADNSRPLLQRVAVITGASRGIGRALAERFAEAGCDLALGARNPKVLLEDKIAERFGIRVLISACDVRNELSVSEFFQSVGQGLGHIDILINNAGIAAPLMGVAQIPLAEWQDVINTNLTGTFLCTRAALPLMRRGGTIVNNLSIAAKSAFAGESPYVAAKHGAKGFTDALRMELRECGIRVLGLYPGATSTDIWSQFWPDAPRERMILPDVVARAVLHAVLLPENAAVEELVIGPTAGAV